MTKVDLCTDEAQALLDGINVVIQEKARDIAFFAEGPMPLGPARDGVLNDLRRELRVAKSARTKIAGVR